jgi:hypothetical protein
MAFGYMLSKWGILWKPLRNKIKNVPLIVMGIVRLHNFLINERLMDEDDFDLNNDINTENNTGVGPRQNEKQAKPLMELKEYEFEGNSFIREAMKDRITSLGLERPTLSKLNLKNNKDM